MAALEGCTVAQTGLDPAVVAPIPTQLSKGRYGVRRKIGGTGPALAPSVDATSGGGLHAPETVGPMIVQTASLDMVATNYDEASAAIEKLAAAHGGYVEKLNAKTQTGSARELSAALRIPAKQLDGLLADLRKLGHVEEESRENEEVSAQYVDLQARLKSARATEQRLIELLGTRTGKLSDVLDAERELARIRSEIESMQGQNAILVHRVSYATVQVELSEEYRERLSTDFQANQDLECAGGRVTETWRMARWRADFPAGLRAVDLALAGRFCCFLPGLFGDVSGPCSSLIRSDLPKNIEKCGVLSETGGGTRKT